MRMGKEKRRQQKDPNPVQPLEGLLRIGEATLYGQVCWSIANRGTELPRPGEVIALEGEDETGLHTKRSFNLTLVSIENIERCFGMKTCGDAVALFADEVELEPRGECPQGHQEAAFAYMMHGIQPTERCPVCGEIPTFLNAAMSLDFHSDGPVKAIDGQEYAKCPECGGDALELHGSNPVTWGWNIVCFSCGWEMKQAERLDIAQYCDLMEEVKSRVESISQLMELPGITMSTRVESICLQLRMLLELVVFSSLVSNKDVWQKSRNELQSSQDISKKLRELKRLHPNFYPKPVEQRASPSGEEPVELTYEFLSEDKLIEVYGRLGNILHADNPMGKETDYRFFMESVPRWMSLVQRLLECHKVYLFHHPEEFYLIKMFGDVDGELLCFRFERTAEGVTKCAWPDCVSSKARQYCEYIQRPWGECLLPEFETAQTEGKAMAGELDLLAGER